MVGSALEWLIVAGATYVGFRMVRKGVEMLSDQEDYIARTIWGEARGEGARGMQAVANVIMNRVKAGSWYGTTPKDVVLKKWQFSCWNDGDPNKSKMLAVTAADRDFANAQIIAQAAYNGNLPDITNGATHYYAYKSIKEPSWVKDMTYKTTIGNHKFYKE